MVFDILKSFFYNNLNFATPNSNLIALVFKLQLQFPSKTFREKKGTDARLIDARAKNIIFRKRIY